VVDQEQALPLAVHHERRAGEMPREVRPQEAARIGADEFLDGAQGLAVPVVEEAGSSQEVQYMLAGKVHGKTRYRIASRPRRAC